MPLAIGRLASDGTPQHVSVHVVRVSMEIGMGVV